MYIYICRIQLSIDYSTHCLERERKRERQSEREHVSVQPVPSSQRQINAFRKNKSARWLDKARRAQGTVDDNEDHRGVSCINWCLSF